MADLELTVVVSQERERLEGTSVPQGHQPVRAQQSSITAEGMRRAVERISKSQGEMGESRVVEARLTYQQRTPS